MPHSTKDEVSTAPQSAGSWTSFLKLIASFSGDLSSVAAPPFVLSTTSLVEYSSYWADRPSFFVAPANEPDPAKRALLVLKWFLSTLRQRTTYRDGKVGGEKKPLNPFLGEFFLGKWEDAAVTAYSINNERHGVRLTGSTAPKTSFSNTVHINQSGHALLHLSQYNETHHITLPPLHIEGLLTGSPCIELSKSSYIRSSSGFIAKINYSGRGWLGRGKRTSFTATLYPEGRQEDVLYTVEGQWSGEFTIREGKTGRKVEIFDSAKYPSTPIKIAPVEKQDPMESRRAWQCVITGIIDSNMEVVSREKNKIENHQRQLRKQERAEGREWKSRYFERVVMDPVLETLSRGKSGGVWRLNSKGEAGLGLKARQS